MRHLYLLSFEIVPFLFQDGSTVQAEAQLLILPTYKPPVLLFCNFCSSVLHDPARAVTKVAGGLSFRSTRFTAWLLLENRLLAARCGIPGFIGAALPSRPDQPHYTHVTDRLYPALSATISSIKCDLHVRSVSRKISSYNFTSAGLSQRPLPTTLRWDSAVTLCRHTYHTLCVPESLHLRSFNTSGFYVHKSIFGFRSVSIRWSSALWILL